MQISVGTTVNKHNPFLLQNMRKYEHWTAVIRSFKQTWGFQFLAAENKFNKEGSSTSHKKKLRDSGTPRF